MPPESPLSPAVVVFDVNETLSDMSAMAARFIDLGAPGHLAPLWFAALLRDGFALTAAGASAPFAVLGEQGLRTVLHGVPLDRDLDAAVAHVLAGFAELDVHPDVPDGVRLLATAGLRLVTLSNGSADVADTLLTRAGIRPDFERLLSVADAGAWKPSPRAYTYAAEQCGTGLAGMLLVAVHPWDVDGAARAGMRTAWIDRDGSPYPASCTAPDVTATSLVELAAVLARRR